MSEESQADPKVQELIEEFQSIKTEPGLRQWEKNNKDRLKSAPYAAMMMFNTHWEGIVKGSYLVSVTDIDIPTLQQRQLPGRIDPSGNHYKTERIFTSIEWKKNTYTTGRGLEKEVHHTYDLAGVHTLGRSRQIVNKCKPERLETHLGKKIAGRILKAGTNQTEATIKEVSIEAPKTAGQKSQKPLELAVLVEGYWEVRFAGKANEADKDDVEIQWEGQCLQMQREVPVILPGRHIEVNDNAHHPVYLKVGDEPLKIVGRKHHFPMTVLRECTKEEHDLQKAEGNKITRLARDREKGMAA